MNENLQGDPGTVLQFLYYQNHYKSKKGGRVSGSAFEYQLPVINYCCKILYHLIIWNRAPRSATSIYLWRKLMTILYYEYNFRFESLFFFK